MRALFLYGTLRHLPLLETVLGRRVAAGDLSDGSLPDHRVASVAEGPFPMILSAEGEDAGGLVLDGLSAEDIDRIDFYEGGFDYRLEGRALRDGRAVELYFPPEGGLTAVAPWSLEAWEKDWAALSVIAAREVMSYFGRRTAREVAALFPRIRARAQSRLNAAHGRHGAGTLDGKVKIERQDRVYSGFFAMDRVTFRHDRFDGGLSDLRTREVFVSTDAAIVLPYDPTRDRVLLVEQVRMGPLGRGDPVLWQLEPVAGLVDPGETPQETARREAREEAGIGITELIPIAEVYASPGAVSDFHYVFVGLCDLPDQAKRSGGCAEEGEDIRVHVMAFSDLFEMAETLRTANSPLTLAAYWLAAHRPRLRASA